MIEKHLQSDSKGFAPSLYVDSDCTKFEVDSVAVGVLPTGSKGAPFNPRTRIELAGLVASSPVQPPSVTSKHF